MSLFYHLLIWYMLIPKALILQSDGLRFDLPKEEKNFLKFTVQGLKCKDGMLSAYE